ncbi:hypothetical protein [Neobacillus niacini]|uniref:hypothetical protein n=1 Tax=Neobacillus niacini TaxID=86668 RepID=UPI00285D0B61|nr:hypothetical protein [Neobacillus niacini]MDR7001555.1 hypothetical protein [Neobacillus niacini]
MDKRINIEGSAASRMVQLMRKHGHNRDVTIELATVVMPLPDLSVKLSSDGLVLEREDLVIAGIVATYSLIAGDQVIVIGDDDTQFYYVIDKAVE